MKEDFRLDRSTAVPAVAGFASERRATLRTEKLRLGEAIYYPSSLSYNQARANRQ